MKNFITGFVSVVEAFLKHLWTFAFDMVTNPADQYDDKRVLGILLFVLGLCVLFKIIVVAGIDPNAQYWLMSTGLALHLGAGATDGLIPIKGVSQSVSTSAGR